MDKQIVAVFCLSSGRLNELHRYEDPQCQMNNAEVMTTAIVTALFFRFNFELARNYLKDEGYIPGMLSKVASIAAYTLFKNNSLPSSNYWVKPGRTLTANLFM